MLDRLGKEPEKPERGLHPPPPPPHPIPYKSVVKLDASKEITFNKPNKYMSPQSHNLELQTATISLDTTARLNSFELDLIEYNSQQASIRHFRNEEEMEPKFVPQVCLGSLLGTRWSAIVCFHMTSWRPYLCPKTMKRRPCWCPKPVLWELNSFLM